jgi:vacuolar-type H+-ATPase subunit H
MIEMDAHAKAGTDGSTESIKKIQEAELKARDVVAKAEADSVKRVEDSKMAAIAIEEKGESEAAELFDRILADAEKDIARRKESVAKRIDSYVSRIQKLKLSQEEIRETAEGISKELS